MNASPLRVVTNGKDNLADLRSLQYADNKTLAMANIAEVNSPPAIEPIKDSADCPHVLRILTGPHTGAESILRNERVLIGNLEGECDIVLDVARDERHACLVRISADGWTVLAIAGDLWVDQVYLAVQQTLDIASGSVLTLGRVAFSIARQDQVDWSTIKAPFSLVKPDIDGPLPSVGLVASRQEALYKWHALKLGAGIGVSALVLASAGAFLLNAWTLRTPTAETAVLQLKANQATVYALPYGKELVMQPATDVPNKFLVQGYLPKRADAAALEFALRKADINAEYRLIAVDEMAADLAQRLSERDGSKIRYEQQGRFVIASKTDRLDVQDRQSRQAMQEMASLSAINLRVDDVLDQEGKPVIVRYERSADRPGDLLVSDLDVIRQRERFIVRELRLGKFPSIVLESGLRYFEGATLPDKSVLKQISETALVLEQGRGERTIPLPAQLLVTKQQPDLSPINVSKDKQGNRRK